MSNPKRQPYKVRMGEHERALKLVAIDEGTDGAALARAIVGADSRIQAYSAVLAPKSDSLPDRIAMIQQGILSLAVEAHGTQHEEGLRIAAAGIGQAASSGDGTE